MTFHPNKSVDVIFTKVETLVDLVGIAKSPFSKTQEIDLAYIVLQK